MSIKLRILSVFSALCFLGSIACFSGFAAELMNNPLGEDNDVTAAPTASEPGYVDPGYTDPGTSYVDPGYTDPGTSYVDPGYTDPGYTDPGTVTPEPTVSTDPGTNSTPYDPGYTDPGSTDPATSEPVYSAGVSDVISEGNYPQNTYSDYTGYYTSSTYVDYTSQYNQYIENTYQAKYDDNYYYVPSYTVPEESLIEINSKEVDTDELTKDDWTKIMLDLSEGNITENGTQTFNFIKNNTEEGDTSVDWMLYLGIVLILLAIFTVIFVVITTNKANDKLNYA